MCPPEGWVHVGMAHCSTQAMRGCESICIPHVNVVKCICYANYSFREMRDKEVINMHKEFLMGNEAIALGALAAGVNLVAGYPGTPSTEVLETIAKRNPGNVYVEW